MRRLCVVVADVVVRDDDASCLAGRSPLSTPLTFPFAQWILRAGGTCVRIGPRRVGFERARFRPVHDDEFGALCSKPGTRELLRFPFSPHDAIGRT